MNETYVWDLGFDFDAIQGSNTQSFLQSGLTQFSTGALAGPVIIVGSKIRFNVYNVTFGATLGGYSISGAEITFTNALKGNESNPCPFNPSSKVVFGNGFARITLQALGPASSLGTSSMFGLHPSSLPFWDSIVGEDLSIQNTGKFLMTVALIVQGPSGLPRTFVVDPEMVVGSVG